MGTRGPVPKRDAERRRVNKPEVETTTVEIATPVVSAPETPADLHLIAAEWFDSLRESGQSRFYEPSDWALAKYVATAMSKSLKARRFSATMFAVVLSAQAELLTTEGARRRSRLELQREVTKQAPPPGVAAISDFRKRSQA